MYGNGKHLFHGYCPFNEVASNQTSLLNVQVLAKTIQISFDVFIEYRFFTHHKDAALNKCNEEKPKPQMSKRETNCTVERMQR